MINQSVDQDSTLPVEWIPGTCPAILYINRKIHREATEILYSENAFVISVTSVDLHQRFPSCPQKNRSTETGLLLSFKTRFIDRSRKVFHIRVVRSKLDLHTHTKIQLIQNLYIDLPDLDLVHIDDHQPLVYHHCNSVSMEICKVHMQPWKEALEAIRKKFKHSSRLDKLRLVFAPGLVNGDCGGHALKEILHIRDVDDATRIKARD